MTERDAVYDKPICYEEGERVVYRASSLGMCLGALTRARLGVSGSAPSDMMQERFQEGHDWEARVLAAGLGVDWVQVMDAEKLAAWGTVVESEAGSQVQTEVAWGGDKGKVIRCHPDAIAIQGSTLRAYVVEVKFLGEQMFDDIVLRGEWPVTYQWQKAVEMLSTGLPLLYVIGKKVVTEGKDGSRVVELGEVWTGEFDTPPFSLKEVKARVLEVEGYVSRGEMPACPVPPMYPCPYWEHHEKSEIETIDNEVLAEWVAVWRLAQKAYETAARDLEFAKKAVKEQMAELGRVNGRCAGVDISVVAEGDGAVSWARAYKELAKVTGKDVELEKFRGKPRAGYVKIAEAKD